MVKVIFQEQETVILYSGGVVPYFYRQMGAFTVNPFRIQGKKKIYSNNHLWIKRT